MKDDDYNISKMVKWMKTTKYAPVKKTPEEKPIELPE